MTSEHQKWQKLKNNYLKQVEGALASIDHPKKADVLRDVNEHLERKYAELTPNQQNWEGCQQILIEMGPPQDYAELLMEGKTPSAKSTSSINTFLAVIFVCMLAAVGSYLVYTAKQTPPQTEEVVVQEEKTPVVAEELKVEQKMPVAFIISFKSASPLLTGTAQELLTGFNKYHLGIPTHHYRTKIQDKELIGNICVDSKSDAEAVKEILQQNGNLRFIKIQPATQKEFEQFCLLKQVSLPSTLEQKEEIQIIQTPLIEKPAVLGKWLAIDCVKDIKNFMPNQKTFKKALILKELHFTSPKTVYWNFNNTVLKETSFTETALETINGHRAKYSINVIGDQDYLFVEWITPGVIKEEKEPDYYVLRRQQEFYVPDEQPASNARVINTSPVGRWIPVDFVKNISDFRPGEKQWTDDLYLKNLTFFENGNTSGPWTWRQNYLWHPGDRTQSHFTIQQMQGSLYLFMEWKSGDVTIRGQRPAYYVLKKTTNSTRLANTSRGSNFTLGASYCTANYVRSIFGPPKRVDSGGRMLRYSDDGIDFWFSNNGPLSEVHLNRGYNGKLETGVSLASSKQEVFATYGQPGRVVQTDKLSGRNDERILYQNGNTSRIYYGRHGLIFWFRDNAINQIVVFKGRFDVDRL